MRRVRALTGEHVCVDGDVNAFTVYMTSKAELMVDFFE